MNEKTFGNMCCLRTVLRSLTVSACRARRFTQEGLLETVDSNCKFVLLDARYPRSVMPYTGVHWHVGSPPLASSLPKRAALIQPCPLPPNMQQFIF